MYNGGEKDVNKRMLSSRSNSKTGRLDIRAKFNNGEDCNIELQVMPYPYMTERMLEYWSRMYDNKISSGQSYKVLKPSISILIADYELDELKDISKYHTIWNLREKEFCEKIITKNIEMHVLEIPKIENMEILNDELAQWLKFIENPGNEEVDKVMSENIFLKQAKEELAHLSGDPDFQRLVESREGMLKDIYCFKEEAREKGLEEGRKEGIKEGKISNAKKIAKKMKTKNMAIEEIAELTELSKEEIEKL